LPDNRGRRGADQRSTSASHHQIDRQCEHGRLPRGTMSLTPVGDSHSASERSSGCPDSSSLSRAHPGTHARVACLVSASGGPPPVILFGYGTRNALSEGDGRGNRVEGPRRARDRTAVMAGREHDLLTRFSELTQVWNRR
jgi:hypothetical protein